METGTCTEAEPFALRVIDDSMEPEFKQGCIIVIDPTGVAANGAYVFAEYQGEYIFRQLQIEAERLYLKPLNEGYPTLELPQGIQAVKGVVVQRAGIRRRYHKHYA